MLAAIFITIATILTMGLIPSSFAELDVQVYEGEGTVGIIVSEVGSGVATGNGSEIIVEGNGTEIVSGNNTETTTAPTNIIEIPHIGSYPITYYNATEGSPNNNVTSSTEMIEIVGGGNLTTETTSTETGGNQTQPTTEELLEQGFGCLSSEELRKLIELLSLFSK